MARRPLFKKQKFDLTGDWEGYNFTAITNLPLGVIEDWSGKEAGTAAMRELLGKALTDWNFVKEDGVEFPQPTPETTADTLRDLPHDLVAAMAKLYVDTISALPQA